MKSFTYYGFFEVMGIDYFKYLITVFPHIVRGNYSFLNSEIVENSNSCSKFQFFTECTRFLLRKLKEENYMNLTT